MRDLHVLCAVVIIVCLGCSGNKPPNGGGKRDGDKGPALPGSERGTIDLSPLPEAKGGIPMPGSSGEVTYCREFDGTFKAIVTLKGLKKSHKYILTLNGEVGRRGNNELIKAGRRDNSTGEGVVDRPMEGSTDPNGNWTGEFPYVRLDPNDYDVKFFVKDASDAGQRCVLYNDYLSFRVTK